MHVFVTGPSGHAGSYVIPELIAAGHEVTGLARSDKSAAAVSALGARVCRGDLADLDVLKAAAGESDGVIHLGYRADLLRSGGITALRDSELSFVSRATFEAVAQDTPELSRHLLIVVTRRLRDTNNALTATNFLSVKGRVASALLQLVEAFGRDVGSGRILIEQKVSQNELAAMAGIARENVTRVLTDWTNRSWLSRLAGYYCLENKKAIRGEAGVASTSGSQ